MTDVCRMMTSVVRALRSWWRADRIRVPPREGQLLRLQPGWILILDGCPVEVLERCVCQAAGTEVTYHCAGERASAELRVAAMDRGRRAAARWQGEGTARILSEEQIEILERRDEP